MDSMEYVFGLCKDAVAYLNIGQVIPRHILEQAKGFAIFTVFKAGFVFSARAGSGIVIARLEDGGEYTLCIGSLS